MRECGHDTTCGMHDGVRPRTRQSESGIERSRESSHDPWSDLPTVLGNNLKRFRTRRGYSLDRLAQLSGVSRAMIGQIEAAKSVPTVSLLSRLAAALGIELACLLVAQETRGPVILRGQDAKVLHSSGGKFTARALLPPGQERCINFHEVRLAPLHCEVSEIQPPGTRKNLILVQGTLAVSTGGTLAGTLNEGDAFQFNADAPHSFRNLAKTEAVFYLLTRYAD
jgi:transcriptional regulator with XRE-family HTH domain